MDIAKVFDLKPVSADDVVSEDRYGRMYARGFKDAFNDVQNDRLLSMTDYRNRIPGYQHGYLDGLTKTLRQRLSAQREGSQ